MSEKFLNLYGLTTLWSKIKTALNGKMNFRYGRIYIATSYNDVARRYVLLAKAEITFNQNWQETSEFILRFYPNNNVKILKLNLRIGGTKTEVHASKYLQHSYLENMTEAQAAAVRVRYTFSEGRCKFWIYLDRSIYAPIFTCVQIQPLSIGSGDRSNKISNGLEQWIFSNGNDKNDALVSAEMEGESELEIESREIHANILSAQTLTQTLPISKGGTGATTSKAAEYNLMTRLRSASNLEAEFTDDSKIPCLLSNELVSTTNGIFDGYRKASQIWTYIQSKISSVLGLTKDAYGGKAASADSATKATADANGNNIANTYATKTELSDEAAARSEADESLQENINAEARARVSADNALQESINSKANSSELSSKLNTSGSNASITTTNALLDKGDVISDYTKLSDNDYVITKSSNTNRTSLGSLYAWIISKFESLTGRFLNLQVYQGENGALTNVATDYSLNLNYYTKSAVDTLLAKKANGIALNSLGTRVTNLESEKASLKDVANFTNATSYNGFLGVPMTICWSGGTSVAASTLFGYGTDYADNGRILVFVNGTDGSVSVTGLTDGSYSVTKGRCLQIVKWGTQYFPMNDKT